MYGVFLVWAVASTLVTRGAQLALNNTQCYGYKPFINMTISPCDSNPCIYKKAATYTIEFYAKADYSKNLTYRPQKDFPYLDTGKLQGALKLKQLTEDFRLLHHVIRVNFTDPQVTIPLRVEPDQVFKGSIKICQKFYPGSLQIDLMVKSLPHYFGCATTELKFVKEPKKCLNYDDSAATTQARHTEL